MKLYGELRNTGPARKAICGSRFQMAGSECTAFRYHGPLRKEKALRRKKRRRRIAFAICFWVMQEKINEVLPNTVETTFAAFVDVKSVPFGDA